VGTSWEFAAGHDQKNTKKNDHHDAPPRTMKDNPAPTRIIQSPKTQGKLVKWHGGSGYKKERHATPMDRATRTVTRARKVVIRSAHHRSVVVIIIIHPSPSCIDDPPTLLSFNLIKAIIRDNRHHSAQLSRRAAARHDNCFG